MSYEWYVIVVATDMQPWPAQVIGPFATQTEALMRGWDAHWPGEAIPGLADQQIAEAITNANQGRFLGVREVIIGRRAR